MNIVLFEKNEISCPLKLNDERAQHILKILHKKEGDTFSCGIIKGMAGKAEIIHISEEGIKLGNDLIINLNKENQSYLSIGNTYKSYNKQTKEIIQGK